MVDDSHIRVIRHTTGELISKVRHKSDSFFNLAYVYSAATRKLYICYPSKALCSVSMSDLIKLNGQSLSAPEIKECLTFLDNSNNRQQSNYPNLKIFDDQRVILLYYRLYGHKRYLRYRISTNEDRLVGVVDSVDVNKAVQQQFKDDRISSLKLIDYEARGIGPNHLIFYTTEIGSCPKCAYFVGYPHKRNIKYVSWVKCDRLMSERIDMQSSSMVIRGNLYLYEFSLKHSTYSLLGFSNDKLAFLLVNKPCVTLAKISKLVKDRVFGNSLTLMSGSNNSSLVSCWSTIDDRVECKRAKITFKSMTFKINV